MNSAHRLLFHLVFRVQETIFMKLLRYLSRKEIILHIAQKCAYDLLISKHYSFYINYECCTNVQSEGNVDEAYTINRKRRANENKKA